MDPCGSGVLRGAGAAHFSPPVHRPKGPTMNQSQFTTPIPIVCLDPIEHTAKAPYCLDSTCPCQPTFEVIKAWFLGTCAHLDATKRDVYTVHLLPGLKEPVWLVYEWLGTAPRGVFRECPCTPRRCE